MNASAAWLFTWLWAWARSFGARARANREAEEIAIAQQALVQYSSLVEGARLERERIKAVYEGVSWIALEPLTLQFMFDGVTPPGAAAQAKVAMINAERVFDAEAVRTAAQATPRARQ